MKFKLKMVYKLFFAMLISSGAALVLMSMFMQWSLNQGFQEYLDRLDVDAERDFVNRLATEYAVHGWRRLESNRQVWHDLREGNSFGTGSGHRPPQHWFEDPTRSRADRRSGNLEPDHGWGRGPRGPRRREADAVSPQYGPRSPRDRFENDTSVTLPETNVAKVENGAHELAAKGDDSLPETKPDRAGSAGTATASGERDSGFASTSGDPRSRGGYDQGSNGVDDDSTADTTARNGAWSSDGRRAVASGRRGGRDLPPRYVLLDANHRPIAGRAINRKDLLLEPILHQGNIVGYLGIGRRENPITGNDYRFLADQYRKFYMFGGLVLVLASLVSVFLARHFSSPIKSLARAAHDLASGAYKTRVEVSRGDELGQLGQDFNHLANTLAHNQEARQRWIADISHELRTPLAVMRGELEAIQDGVRRPDDGSIKSLHNEVLCLSQIVNDLYELSLSDLGALNYKKEPLHPSEVLDQVVHLYEPRLARRELQLEYHANLGDEVEISGDHQRLTQLFSNLLENCSRYTNAGGMVRVTARMNGEEILVGIEDTPPGVPEEMLGKLFERLFRAEVSRSRKHGGAGLGLAICKNIVEAHQGSIEAKTSELGGLAVWIHFPLERWT
ncbi:Histidine kinase [Sulfidibacter corallicola]|uniref:histidine kinase n=1 Tax=Sulfidibacter corallicola TaxID=2818388 RepID=A0A8A4TRQ1_SULCO|nr:ATP-binding protein [Sulfidibacter corallicola]QTD49215.1 HAMP domain-containing protein [Sulfidibacter corallicola]